MTKLIEPVSGMSLEHLEPKIDLYRKSRSLFVRSLPRFLDQMQGKVEEMDSIPVLRAYAESLLQRVPKDDQEAVRAKMQTLIGSLETPTDILFPNTLVVNANTNEALGVGDSAEQEQETGTRAGAKARTGSSSKQ